MLRRKAVPQPQSVSLPPALGERLVAVKNELGVTGLLIFLLQFHFPASTAFFLEARVALATLSNWGRMRRKWFFDYFLEARRKLK